MSSRPNRRDRPGSKPPLDQTGPVAEGLHFGGSVEVRLGVDLPRTAPPHADSSELHLADGTPKATNPRRRPATARCPRGQGTKPASTLSGSRSATVPAIRSCRHFRSPRTSMRMKEIERRDHETFHKAAHDLPQSHGAEGGHPLCLRLPAAHAEHLVGGGLPPSPDEEPPDDVADEEGDDHQDDGEEVGADPSPRGCQLHPGGEREPAHRVEDEALGHGSSRCLAVAVAGSGWRCRRHRRRPGASGRSPRRSAGRLRRCGHRQTPPSADDHDDLGVCSRW